MKLTLVLILIIGATFAHTCLMDKPAHSTSPSTVQSAPAHAPSLNTEAALRDRLGVAIADHPDAQVRKVFFPLIKNGKILTAWAQGQLSGHFALVRPEQMQPRRPGTDPVPTLVIDPHLLSNPREATMLSLVIYHEYIHYLQWANGRWPEETFLLKRVDETKNMNEWCEQKWYAEMEAYQKECAFARKIEALKLLPFCTADGALGTDQYKEAMQGDLMAPFCGEVWITL